MGDSPPVARRCFRPALTAPSPASVAAVPTCRLITYNILADALCMTEKHSYCPHEHREWEGRFARLTEEISSYEPDVVCLQECNVRAFERFCADWALLRPSAAALPASAVGTEGLAFHHAHLLEGGTDQASARASETGLAILVRSSQWRPLAARAQRLGTLDGARRHSGRLGLKLRSQSDSVMMLLLEHVATGARLVVANTHLHWDPRWPHLKASQAELVAHAVHAFALASIPRGAPGAASPGATGATGATSAAGRAAFGSAAPGAVHGGAEAQAPPVAIAGDYNSVPHLQPHFLPAPLRRVLPAVLPDLWRPSAVYGLLSCGSLAADHPEHPSAFEASEHAAEAGAQRDAEGDASAAAEADTDPMSAAVAHLPTAGSGTGAGAHGGARGDAGACTAGGADAPQSSHAAHGMAAEMAAGTESQACSPEETQPPLSTRAETRPAKRRRKKKAKVVGPLCTRLRLRDAYAGALGPGPLPLTTHADDFAGALDYIWIGGVATEGAPGSGAAAAPPEVLEVLSMPYDLAHADGFGKIPCQRWPSDHLCLGLLLAIRPRDANPAAGAS